MRPQEDLPRIRGVTRRLPGKTNFIKIDFFKYWRPQEDLNL